MKLLYVPRLDRALFAGRPVDLDDARVVGHRWYPQPRHYNPNSQYLVAPIYGDSLRDVRICHGDWVMFVVQSYARAGQLCVIATPSGLTCKFYHPQPDGTVLLRSANPEYSDQYWDEADIRLRGVVVASGRDWV